jgi:hypothetical protein
MEYRYHQKLDEQLWIGDRSMCEFIGVELRRRKTDVAAWAADVHQEDQKCDEPLRKHTTLEH